MNQNPNRLGRKLVVIVIGAVVVVTTACWMTRSSSSERKASQIATTAQETAATGVAVPVVDASSKDSSMRAAVVQTSTPDPKAALDVNETLAEAEVQPAGDRTAAKINYNGKEQRLVASDIGDYPKFYIDPLGKVPVTLNFPKGQPGDPVLVQVEDGGHLDRGKGPVEMLNLDENKNASFQFQASEDRGIYRVAVRSGAEVNVLQFWAGPENPQRSADGIAAKP